MKWRIGLRKATARATGKPVEWSPSTGTDAIRDITEAVQRFLIARLARLSVNPDLKTAKTLCLQFTFQALNEQGLSESELCSSELPLFPPNRLGRRLPRNLRGALHAKGQAGKGH